MFLKIVGLLALFNCFYQIRKLIKNESRYKKFKREQEAFEREHYFK